MTKVYNGGKSQPVKESLLTESSPSLPGHIVQRKKREGASSLGLCDKGIGEFATLDSLEYLQDRLLDGDECRYEYRSPMTVNTTMGTIMTFIRYCHAHRWITDVPPIQKLDVADVMKGRPITPDEFQRMIAAAPDIVGERSAESWRQVLYVLWESAFRVGDVMNFSWDDERRIHPVWPTRQDDHPTLAIPSSQKNKKVQEIPMLPGLQELLSKTPQFDRRGWVANPEPIDYAITPDQSWCKPARDDLERLAADFNNSAIARACGVTEASVRKWLKQAGIQRTSSNCNVGQIAKSIMTPIRKRAAANQSYVARRSVSRLTKEHVGRTIGRIGEQAAIVVQQPDENTRKRLKYASAHDIRRGCAQRLINAGISAETLKLVLRHKDFSTTERYYGATRAAQAAATEIHNKLLNTDSAESTEALTSDEISKIKALLNSI